MHRGLAHGPRAAGVLQLEHRLVLPLGKGACVHTCARSKGTRRESANADCGDGAAARAGETAGQGFVGRAGVRREPARVQQAAGLEGKGLKGKGLKGKGKVSHSSTILP